jgi:hypothetical protein
MADEITSDDSSKDKKKKLDIEKLKKDLEDSGLKLISKDDYWNMLMSIKNKHINDIVSENMAYIVRENPNLFNEYGINLPADHEEYLFDIYYGKTINGKTANLEKITLDTKFIFSDIKRYLVDLHDETRLDKMMMRYKKIIDGSYLPDL